MGSPAFPKIRGVNPEADRTQDNISGQLQPIARALAATPIMGAPPPAWQRPDLLADFTPIAGQAVTAFHKNALGYVYGKGALTSPAGQLALTTIYLLPLGCRPLELQAVAVVGVGPAQSIGIFPDGRVVNTLALAAGDSIYPFFTFLAEQ